MVQAYQSNSGIHGYSDKGGRPVFTGYHGWFRDTRVTIASKYTMTRWETAVQVPGDTGARPLSIHKTLPRPGGR